jgi:hypothetical protein
MKKNKFWFRKRRGLFSRDLGYGWVPISWEGSVMVGVFLLLILSSVFYLNLQEDYFEIKFLGLLAVFIIIFSIIAKSKTKK